LTPYKKFNGLWMNEGELEIWRSYIFRVMAKKKKLITILVSKAFEHDALVARPDLKSALF